MVDPQDIIQKKRDIDKQERDREEFSYSLSLSWEELVAFIYKKVGLPTVEETVELLAGFGYRTRFSATWGPDGKTTVSLPGERDMWAATVNGQEVLKRIRNAGAPPVILLERFRHEKLPIDDVVQMVAGRYGWSHVKTREMIDEFDERLLSAWQKKPIFLTSPILKHA
ncbi:MAG: hypothetical protein HQM03_20930, partial [Magnetococcales bacterium]|nr:hypothetical protein [Magnetococcales bacterium]